jgi:hypothetical protein
MIAECVFNKDAAELCDSNNRALAVDAVGRHLRHADSVLAQPNVTASLQISRLAALKERVIVGFRGHLRDGSFIAADFGMFAPDEVRRIARDTKPIRQEQIGSDLLERSLFGAGGLRALAVPRADPTELPTEPTQM